MAAFDTAWRSSSRWSVMANRALRSGSSQHGKARRASVASNWVVAITRSIPVVVGEGGAVEAAELVVEAAPEPQRHHGLARRQLVGEGEGGPLGIVVEGDGGGPAGRPPLSTQAWSISSSMALSTTSWVASATSTSMSTEPSNVAVVQVGGEGEGVPPRDDRARQAMGVGHGARLLGALGQPRATSRCAPVMPRCVPIRSGGAVPTRPPCSLGPRDRHR